MMNRLWKLACRILLVAGGLITFFALIELLRAFFFFYRVHPAWGWAFAGVVSLLLLTALVYVWRSWIRLPRALAPPPLPPLGEASHKEMKRFCQYLIEYLDRLSQNPNLTDEARHVALDHIVHIEDVLRHHPLNEDLVMTIQKTEDDILPVILGSLDEQAEREIRRSVRDVMLGVTLSPYHSMDLLIVLYRNSAMILRIAHLHGSRPSSADQWHVLRDVLRVIATVNFLYIGRNLIENLFAFVPIVGRVADDIGQGIGAGLFTSAAGHAAIERCSAYRGWNKQAAAESLASQTRDFLKDVKNIFTKDVLPDIRNRILTEAPPEQVRQPGFWDSVQSGIGKAFDSTSNALNTILLKPATAGVQTILNPVPRRVEREPLNYEHRHTGNHGRHRRKNSSRGIGRVLRTFGQRLRYTFRIGRLDGGQ